MFGQKLIKIYMEINFLIKTFGKQKNYEFCIFILTKTQNYLD